MRTGEAILRRFPWRNHYRRRLPGSTVTLIDLGCVEIALLLGWLFRPEALTPAKLTGSGFIAAGLPVIARG